MLGTMEAIAYAVFFCFALLLTLACKLVLVKNVCVSLFKQTGQCCPPPQKKRRKCWQTGLTHSSLEMHFLLSKCIAHVLFFETCKLEGRDFSTNFAKKRKSHKTPTIVQKCRIITLAEFQHPFSFLFLNTPKNILIYKEHTCSVYTCTENQYDY